MQQKWSKSCQKWSVWENLRIMSDAHPPRFLVSAPLISGAELDLPEQPARHVAVLRLREGDRVTLFCGDGGEYAAVLTQIARKLVRVRIGERLDVARESPLRITLAQCISSGDRMDLTLQKATELGVYAIVPLSSERSVVKLRDDRADRKHSHWQHVVAAACEQCGRNTVPEVRAPTDIQAWLRSIGEDKPDGSLRLLLAPNAKMSLSNIDRQTDVTLLIGPEGGLAEQEIAVAMRHSFQSIHLGPRVLRTETAPIAAIAALQVLWGDLA
jgi:16S rRNA (uracil1498-N3)-methyltransferase